MRPAARPQQNRCRQAQPRLCAAWADVHCAAVLRCRLLRLLRRQAGCRLQAQQTGLEGRAVVVSLHRPGLCRSQRLLQQPRVACCRSASHGGGPQPLHVCVQHLRAPQRRQLLLQV